MVFEASGAFPKETGIIIKVLAEAGKANMIPFPVTRSAIRDSIAAVLILARKPSWRQLSTAQLSTAQLSNNIATEPAGRGGPRQGAPWGRGVGGAAPEKFLKNEISFPY